MLPINKLCPKIVQFIISFILYTINNHISVVTKIPWNFIFYALIEQSSFYMLLKSVDKYFRENLN